MQVCRNNTGQVAAYRKVCRCFARDKINHALRRSSQLSATSFEKIRKVPAYRQVAEAITRQILEVLAECEHPVTLVTKSALVERDLATLVPVERLGTSFEQVIGGASADGIGQNASGTVAEAVTTVRIEKNRKFTGNPSQLPLRTAWKLFA